QTVALPVVVLAVVVLVLRRGGLHRPRLGVAHLVLALSVVVAFGLWWWAIRSPDTVPTYDDGANAGIFTARIGLLGTVSPDRIIATDLGNGAGGVAYYPLALHLVASFLVSLTGVGIPAALHVEVATVVAITLPVGAFALTRRLARELPGRSLRPGVAAAAAAVLAATVPSVPWGQLPWGALALVSGVALLPGLLLLLHALPTAGSGSAGPRLGLVLGVATAGLFSVHSSEVATAAVLGVALVIALAGRDGARWRAVGRALLVVVAAGVVLLGPVLPDLAGGLQERAAGTPGPAAGAGDALAYGWYNLLSAPQLADQWGGRQRWLAWALTALVVVGVVVARRSRAVVALVVGSGVLALVAFGALVGSSFAQRLATPWYANGYRLLVTLVVVVAVLVGIGAAALAGRPWPRVALVGVALAAFVAVPSVLLSAVIGSRTYAAYSVVTAADRDTYAWLAAHTGPGERVLNDSHDGSMWMYPLAGVAPVFGPKSDLWADPQWADRWYLLKNAADLGTDPRARAIAAEESVRYIAVGDRVVYGAGRQLDRAALAQSSVLREVYRSGSAVVFEIVPDAAAGAASTGT
ncbi:MAG TPA: DUF6541 family protein, partial [Candidatus Nanopelagicales bacterium]|nr:DUF6541 family protein [Candidatus Nanopelagicales bacterium]